MRLIDADLLEKDGFTVQTQEYGSVDVVSLDCIADAPTVEAAPVVHGKWVHPEGAQCETRACSICGNQVTMDFDRTTWETLFKGCPYCFARMDLSTSPLELMGSDDVELTEDEKILIDQMTKDSVADLRRVKDSLSDILEKTRNGYFESICCNSPRRESNSGCDNFKDDRQG